MKHLRDSKGYIMVGVIFTLAFAALFGLLALHIYSTNKNETIRSESKIQAHYIAESGARMVSKYLIDNPTELENILGESESFQLDSNPNNTCIVTVSQDAQYIYIKAKGSVEKDRTYEEEVELVMEKPSNFGFDSAIYVKESLLAKNEMKIYGYISTEGAADTAEIVDDNQEVPEDMVIPDKPLITEYATIPEIQAVFVESPDTPTINPMSYLDSSGDYEIKEDYMIIGGTHSFNYSGGDFHAVFNQLQIENATITFDLDEGRKAYLYVGDKNSFKFSGVDFNMDGEHSDVVIYYTSTDKELLIQNESNVKADIHIQDASKVTIQSANTTYDGHLVYEGENEMDIQNGTSWTNGLLYAPKSKVNFKNNGVMYGVMIAYEIIADGNEGSFIEYQAIEESTIISGSGGKPKLYQWRK
ncbi:hypothetical protein EZV73_13275 [Acidaminobacter sp. JC074]|uniref:hypothetical protein n=1 Tax=Acidaminobacter sp. JC074 TaxID=2530199 RepID=UPI001F0FC243|nr:hypothetical protein [Acidaminobacter sp. JC074]MCH4888558.1 hypothetical protein [Acidaminobacter sp. JC074]